MPQSLPLFNLSWHACGVLCTAEAVSQEGACPDTQWVSLFGAAVSFAFLANLISSKGWEGTHVAPLLDLRMSSFREWWETWYSSSALGGRRKNKKWKNTLKVYNSLCSGLWQFGLYKFRVLEASLKMAPVFQGMISSGLLPQFLVTWHRAASLLCKV